MAVAAVILALLVPLVASRAGKIAVVLAVRIHFLRILRLGFGCNSVIPAVALHTGLVAVLVDFERSFCCISVAGIALDAVACMTVGKKLCCLRLCRAQSQGKHNTEGAGKNFLWGHFLFSIG